MTTQPRCETSKLTQRAAHAKDAGKLAPLQHRHFATIATIIKALGADDFSNVRDHCVSLADAENLRADIAEHFAAKLAKTNDKFDRARFLAACK